MLFRSGLFYMLIYPPTYIETFAIDFHAITPTIWAKITYIVVGVTFFTYLLTMFGLKYVGPSIASAYIYTQPVLVMGFAYLFSLIGLADDYTNTITLEKCGYMLMIFIGVWITAYYGKKH